jgi:hypothetical protein
VKKGLLGHMVLSRTTLCQHVTTDDAHDTMLLQESVSEPVSVPALKLKSLLEPQGRRNPSKAVHSGKNWLTLL